MAFFILIVLGLGFGSFVNAFTWRLHEKKNFVTDRSQCEDCGHTLAPKDLIPIISWLMLRGTCRYCNARISWQNPAVEGVVALLFVVSYIYWPFDLTTWQAWGSFALWLVYIVALAALFVYDVRWMLLPNAVILPLIGLACIDAALRVSLQPGPFALQIVEYAGFGAAALGGTYLLLYMLSKGRWVGFGDVKLGLFMGIVLGWQLALLTLFLANMLAFIVVLPGLVSKKLSRQSKVPFGPFLIVGFIVAGVWGNYLINWYLSWVLLQ